MPSALTSYCLEMLCEQATSRCFITTNGLHWATPEPGRSAEYQQTWYPRHPRVLCHPRHHVSNAVRSLHSPIALYKLLQRLTSTRSGTEPPYAGRPQITAAGCVCGTCPLSPASQHCLPARQEARPSGGPSPNRMGGGPKRGNATEKGARSPLHRGMEPSPPEGCVCAGPARTYLPPRRAGRRCRLAPRLRSARFLRRDGATPPLTSPHPYGCCGRGVPVLSPAVAPSGDTHSPGITHRSTAAAPHTAPGLAGRYRNKLINALNGFSRIPR